MTGKAGVFNYYETIFRAEDEMIYAPYMGEAYELTSKGKPRKDKTAYYTTYWRTYQMSDHCPCGWNSRSTIQTSSCRIS